MRPAAGTRQKGLRFAHGQTDVMDDILKCALFFACLFHQNSQFEPKMIEGWVNVCEKDIK